MRLRLDFRMVPRMLACYTALCAAHFASAVPVAPSVVNPRYFESDGQVTPLIGSGEHYGAVLNLAFNWTTYLDTQAAAGLNLVRTWTGAVYREPYTAFGIPNNTLAPLP